MAVDLKEAKEKMIREAEAKLELERNLRQSEKLAAIGQLASGLAHEIGTPLNIIGGRVEMAKKKLEDKLRLRGFRPGDIGQRQYRKGDPADSP